MSNPAPVNDYDSLVELTGRIHQYLAKHPRDSQALHDLHYVATLMKTTATPAANAQDSPQPPSTHPGAEIASGLMQAGVDLPKGFLTAILHPVQTAGQVTGLGNVGKFRDVLYDSEASIPEKLDALVRATPLNVGYATERGLLNATGAKSDEPASLQDQAHAAGNVASLGLLAVKPSVPLRLVRGGIAKLASPLLDRLAAKPPSSVPVSAPIPAPEVLPSGLRASVVRAALEKQGFQGAALDRAMAAARQPPATPAPTLTPMPGTPQGLLGPEGISPAPKASYPPTISEMQGYNLGKPGHPIWQGEGSPTTSAQVRGGEPLLPSANPAVAEALQRTPFAKLQAALRLPETPTPIKDLILAELSRRGIVGPGLLAPR